ncbi:diguanylate cyclase [Pseudomonas sp. nanlin1]|uniref:GGDEF domain-containing protein n=1 Tax=Pseudomonas sp. nanlin1 TaxID=3040605 RepID=UPI00388CFCC3
MPISDAVSPAFKTDAQALEAIERKIASGLCRLRFSPAIEAQYESETRVERNRFLALTGLVGVLVYNCFLINDYLSLNDAFHIIALGRLGVFTPAIILTLIILPHLHSRGAREGLASFGSVLSVILPLVAMLFSDSPYRMHFQMGTILNMVFCTMIQRLPFQYACGSIVIMVSLQMLATFVSGAMEFAVWRANSLFFIAAAIFLLMGSYFLERDSRMAYLFALRGRILQSQLTTMARTDSLTNLYNRRYLVEVTETTWEDALYSPRNVSVILLDIDNFKAFNDTYGHMQGDQCLQRLSACIKKTASQEDTWVFRFGGEEILVLMLNAQPAEARSMAERLRAEVMAAAIPHPVMGAEAVVTISLGIASGIAPHIRADDLIASADTALYAAKKAGRNRVCCARPEVVNA